jgi:hypothetical protein
MDSGHILNKKIRLLFNEFDSDGYYIWHALVDYGYGKWGYYFDMNDRDELELFASEYCKKKVSAIQEVIAGCIRRGLFDKTVADMFGILTSDMMQETFLIATSERRAKDTYFEMRQEWVLIDLSSDVPKNIVIVPGNNLIVPPKNQENPPNNPQIREDKSRKEERGAPGAPRDRDNGEGSGRKKFIPPVFSQVKAYFLATIGAPDHPKHWPEDKCVNQASLFLDHYKGNGWIQGQGRGRPIKDWEATARNWIKRELGGEFKLPERAKPEPPTPKRQEDNGPKLTPLQIEINALFDLWSENPEHCTVISVTADHYNLLKSAGRVAFSPTETETIKQLALAHMQEKKLEGESYQIRLMKSFGVLEFFKQQKAAGNIEIFELK